MLADSGEAVSMEEVKYGLLVAVIAFQCAPLMRTERALKASELAHSRAASGADWLAAAVVHGDAQAVGPGAFKVDAEYVSVGGYIAPESQAP